jgi:protein TonB
MTQGGYYQPKRLSPIGMATVVLLHGVAITALLTARMDMPDRQKFIRTIVDSIAIPPPPPPRPLPPSPKPQPRQDIPITTTKPIVVPPVEHLTPYPPDPPPPPTGTFGKAETPPLPPTPPPPPPPKFEPAQAHANLGSYVSDADYPDAALRSEEQGTTRFRLLVGRDGKVSDCIVTGSSGSSALDAATCRLMKSRARFTPARDASGNATTDSVASAIRWVLPAG